ncbi:MAG: aldehyde ferredoxin oxidoreductase C-terminal domain-containing protein [Candidatus Promineifilaceae bacterium]|nr:aldehyde ferredoxin oxidoreductase C-terminal domain-containing protein [Candidatus Promineifilaceae bacterium]
MKIWRINTRNHNFQKEPTPPSWQALGGRGLLAQIMVDEVDPTCWSLGAHNPLIFAPGLLVGHRLSSCDRISIGGKSPLTQGIKESNAGGRTGLQLTQLGIKALILEDQPQDDEWWILHLSAAGVHFEPAADLAGRGVYETAPPLLERFGHKSAIVLIGPGGEMGLSAAGIQNVDKDGVPSRIAARGGLGALMGSKRLKAIVIDASQGEPPPITDKAAFRQAQKKYNKALMAHPQTQTFTDYGTSAMTHMCNTMGAMPTRNFSSGQFEGAEKISGEHLRQLMLDRGGESNTSHACMAGCTIRCSNVFGGEDGRTIVSPLEYETIGLMGSNLGIDHLDDIGRLNWEVNDLGLDSIEIGAALGVAAEAGLLSFGDAPRALELLNEIRAGTPLGRILGSGAVTTGRIYNVERVPAVKGQAMSAYEPRVIKGTGVTYATSPQGADHTCGLTIRAKVDHQDPNIQVPLSFKSQLNNAGYDTLGACVFAGYGFAAAPGTLKELLEARYGHAFPDDLLQSLGRRTIRLERQFNQAAGFTAADDRLPIWMTREAVSPVNSVFDVSETELDGIFADL